MRSVADPEGVKATLLSTRRLVKDDGYRLVEALRLSADELSAAKDQVRAFWAALFDIGQVTPKGVSAVDLDVMDAVDVVPFLDEAIRRRGEQNLKDAK